ncbi:MAG TPA: tRNA-dihydrouridine synthase family protein [Deltaproteobacteria bacterium]|nr:tRNA-dihydrouridine synthase family protein [Candidatus Lambdaproteobacteria bacterium]HIN47970.1 tRNA-dihydrouridine synthase family protein [Deltaproteobacteria bacterium]
MKRSSPNHATSWLEVKRPIVCLAPMDGVTNSAYRQIVRSLSKDVILFSEFTSVDGLVRSEHVRLRLDYEPCEHPFFMQLFGNSPEIFAEACRMVEDRGIWGVDINMGCPAKKIVHSQHGSALMQNPDAACRIVEAIRKACSLEVSVKTRLGWKDEKNLISFAKALESAGASMLTIHGRTYNQAFKGESDWQPIYELKRHLTIPVIGNGDIRDFNHGLEHLGNLDGFMIGRAAIGNPWCFQDRRKYPEPTHHERIEIALEHLHLYRRFKREIVAVREFRKYLGNYVSGFRNAKEWRSRLMQCNDEKTFVECMQEIKQLEPPLALAG